MDLIRLIKLKKINGDLDNLSRFETYFFNYFNNLRVHHSSFYDKMNMVIIVDSIDCNKHFQIDFTNKILWCDRLTFLSQVQHEFNIEPYKSIGKVDEILHKRLNLTGYKAEIMY